MKIRYRFISVVLTIVLFLSGTNIYYSYAEQADDLDAKQRNAIAMLNYITVLSQEIHASKNSRLYLEEAYSSLINNTYPNAIADARTLSQVNNLLDTMEEYRMIDVKRERLEYIYEQNHAQAIRSAVPSPLAIINIAQSFRPSKLITSLLYMAVDSATSYTSYTEEQDLQYLKDGWELDDKEKETLHNSRKSAFSYMIEMVSEYDLPGDLILRENDVTKFVEWKNNDNVVGRIQFLKQNKNVYQYYGGYWLLLAKSYYENNQYSECLDSIESFRNLEVRIFVKDYEYAEVLPLAIAAADELYSDDEYVTYVAKCCLDILNNTDNDNWSLRYFVAQVYLDLYAKTNDITWMQEAYTIIKDNCNWLATEQRKMNDTYLAPVVKEKYPEGANTDEKKQIDKYNAMLEKTRNTEMTPVSEALLLNCDLLFAIVQELQFDETELSELDKMLHTNGEPLFLSKTLDKKYWFNEQSEESVDVDIEYSGTAIIMPVSCLTGYDKIVVSVSQTESEDVTTIDDWTITKVERVDDSDVSSYRVTYTSKAASRINWKPDAKIDIAITSDADLDENYHFEYNTVGTKNKWYDYFKVWEGHKNNWYDYAKVWENSVNFERVA